jgi:hypothetical protein
MWGVFSHNGMLLDSFDTFGEAEAARREWGAMWVHWIGQTRLDR